MYTQVDAYVENVLWRFIEIVLKYFNKKYTSYYNSNVQENNFQLFPVQS